MRRLIAPGLVSSQDKYTEKLAQSLQAGASWLDLGCGHQLLPPWRQEQETELLGRAGLMVGFDYDHESLKANQTISALVRGDVSELPFADAQFDLVTANMVIEHLEDPDRQFAEIARVLKPGGSFLFHTPNKHGYTVLLVRLIPEQFVDKVVLFFEGRVEEDVFPTYYRANSRKDILRIASERGLEVRRLDSYVSLGAFMMIPPLVVFELLLLRFLMGRRGDFLKTNWIVGLRKPGTDG